MDNNDLNRLTNALLTAYLDKAHATEVGTICAQFGIVPVADKLSSRGREFGK